MRYILAFWILGSLAAATYAQPSPHVIWDRSGAQDSSRYGAVILPLGDQNNDGYADWAVFAAGGMGNSTDRPYMEFFHGGNPMPTQPYLTYYGIGRGAGVVGDVNGDGYVDWYGRTGAQPGYYRFSIYFGGPNADTLPDWSITEPDDGGWFGSLGDFNGDGYADVFYYHDVPGDYVEVFYGGSPMDTLPDWTLHSTPPHSQEAAPQACGDLNGDGYSDFVTCRGLNGTTYIFLGGTHPDTLPAYTWPNMPSLPLGIVKDMNGDHFNDLVYYNGDIHFGGLAMRSVPDVTLEFPCTEVNAFEAVSAGDFNHDGYNDVILLRNYCTNSNWGVLSLFLGSPQISPQPAFTIEGLTPPLNLHSVWTAAGLGDVNGDSIDDIAIGALDDLDYLGWRGRCIVVAGDTTLRVEAHDLPVPIPRKLEVSVYPNPFNGQTVIQLEVPAGVSRITLTTYNLLGQQVAQKVIPANPGSNRYTYDGRGLSSGIYLLRAQAGQYVTAQKLMLLR